MNREIVPGWCWRVSDDGTKYGFGMQDMRGVDAATFEVLGDWWAKDARTVYCAGSAIRDADPATFRILNLLYAKDANHAYIVKGKIAEADAATFEAFGPVANGFNAENGYARDAANVFHVNVAMKAGVLKSADAATFRSFGHGFGGDASAVYFERMKLPGAKPADWQFLRGPHSRSGKTAYCLQKKIRGADATRLESLPILRDGGEHFCRVGDGYFRQDEPRPAEDYLAVFRQCFIFIGRCEGVVLTTESKKPLDPAVSESWERASRGRITVRCEEWLQKPDVAVVECPELGQTFEFGAGLRLRLVAAGDWRNGNRIWIFTAGQDPTRAEPRMKLYGTSHWWEYSDMDQLKTIHRTIAAARTA